MLDWFYDHWGSSASFTICTIMFFIQLLAFEGGRAKLESLRGVTRLVVTIGVLIVGLTGMFILFNEKAFKYDYVARQFGVEFLQNATDAEIDKRMDELRDEKYGSKTDSDRELYNSLFDWAESTNLNITTIETDYRRNGTVLEVNRDVDFETRRKGSDNE